MDDKRYLKIECDVINSRKTPEGKNELLFNTNIEVKKLSCIDIEMMCAEIIKSVGKKVGCKELLISGVMMRLIDEL